MDLTDVIRTFHPNAEEYTFFSSAHGTFSRIHHILCHKSNFSKFKKTEIVSSIFSNLNTAAAAAKSLQSCPTVCDPIDGSPLGSSLPGILQARNLNTMRLDINYMKKQKTKTETVRNINTWRLNISK